MIHTREGIIDELERAHDGDPWHGPSRMQVLAGITAAQASWSPPGGGHSIWGLVLHMRSWTLEVKRRAEGAVPATPEDGDWPAVPTATPAGWTEALEELDEAHDALVGTVRALPERRFAERVGTTDPDSPGITCAGMLYSLAQHDIYHTGQIAVLKRIVQAR